MICPGMMKEGETTGAYRHVGEGVVQHLAGVKYDDVAHLILRCFTAGLYLHQRVCVSNP